MQRPDLSIIITAHREGIISGATANSALSAISHASKDSNLTCEVILVLDNANLATSETLRHAFKNCHLKIIETQTADPGQSRNAGISRAQWYASAFLDGDDLWSSNWLSEGWKMLQSRPDCIGHSHCNMVFGDQKNLWWHVDSEGELFDPDYLLWANYWDALSIALTETYRNYPFKANDLALGFGHEDWHWNAHTIAQGVAHKPVLNTVHFKRRRPNSVMASVSKADGTVWPISK